MIVERPKKKVEYLKRKFFTTEDLLEQEEPDEIAQRFYIEEFQIEPLISFFEFRSDERPRVTLGYGGGSNINFYPIRYENWEDLHTKLKMHGAQHVYYEKRFIRSIEEDEVTSEDDLLALSLAHEIVFDLDPENYDCQNCGPAVDRDLETFCPDCFVNSLNDTIKLFEFLEKLKFNNIIPVSTGRGFHVHVQDESTLSWSKEQRAALVSQVQEKGIAIDPHVTVEMYLMRMPYSLHGGVNKQVVPLTLSELKSLSQQDK